MLSGTEQSANVCNDRSGALEQDIIGRKCDVFFFAAGCVKVIQAYFCCLGEVYE